MKYIASFDIGTTNVKGVLVTEGAGMLNEENVPLPLHLDGGRAEQDPDSWYEAVRSISGAWFRSGVRPEDIRLIALSGQMQDCIPVGRDGAALRPAILYSDGRGGKQADRLLSELGAREIHRETGNHMDGTLTFPKILWLKEHEPRCYENARSFLISSKDYVIAKLTGALVTDPTSAATAGCMNIRGRIWSESWFERFGIDVGKMPRILASGETAGFVHAQGGKDTGFAEGTPVLCGIGDAGAATLGAGVYREGEIYAYLGTTGWVAACSDGFMDVSSGAFNLAHPEPGRQINIAPLSNAGNAYDWAVKVFGNGGSPDASTAYESFERALGGLSRGSDGVLFLPYLNGERCPVQDAGASGCFIGLRPSTTRERMGAAVLEGVSMAMRELMELADRSGRSEERRVTLIGGGARSPSWCQILADVLQCEIAVPDDSQYLPSLGAALLGFPKFGWGKDFASLSGIAASVQRCRVFVPDRALAGYYDRQFAAYRRMYPALSPLFKQEEE